MKRIVLFTVLMIPSLAFADVKIQVTLTDEEYRAMSVLTVTPEEWVQHAAKNKAGKMIEELAQDYSDKQPGKITDDEKKSIINAINIEAEKNKRRGR